MGYVGYCQGRIRRGRRGSHGYPWWDTKYKEKREKEKKKEREKEKERRKERKGNVFFIVLMQIYIN